MSVGKAGSNLANPFDTIEVGLLIGRFDVVDVGFFFLAVALAERGFIGKPQKQMQGFRLFDANGQTAPCVLFSGQNVEAHGLLNVERDAVVNERCAKIQGTEQGVAIVFKDVTAFQPGEERDRVVYPVQKPLPKLLSGQSGQEGIRRIVDLDKMFEFHA